jgi:predicted Zn-dependent peptidase
MYRSAASRLAVVLALTAQAAAAMHYPGEGRKTKGRDFAVQVQKVKLPNGLVVLLAPDPTDSRVLVRMTFLAGTLYEPPARSGMAHLVEHAMANGPTPETDYAALLERRRSSYFNGATDFETMRFEVIVPPEELPAALWVAADRLGSVPPLIDAAGLERHRRVVLQERAFRYVDAPYGLVQEQLFKRLFPAPHPLHGGVSGISSELAQVTPDDVRAFASAYLVPANAILTVVGRFDPAQARQWIDDGLGRMAGGVKAQSPAVAPFGREQVESKEERISREPRVTLAWRLQGIGHDAAVTLELGAMLLSLLTDGAWGMRVSAGMMEQSAESLFLLDLTVPYDEPAKVVQDDAEGFLRQLTGREMSFELLQVANLWLDRRALFDLDSLDGRGESVERVERLFSSRLSVSQDLEGHWALDPVTVHDTARSILRAPKVILHARPTRPRPAAAGRQ